MDFRSAAQTLVRKDFQERHKRQEIRDKKFFEFSQRQMDFFRRGKTYKREDVILAAPKIAKSLVQDWSIYPIEYERQLPKKSLSKNFDPAIVTYLGFMVGETDILDYTTNDTFNEFGFCLSYHSIKMTKNKLKYIVAPHDFYIISHALERMIDRRILSFYNSPLQSFSAYIRDIERLVTLFKCLSHHDLPPNILFPIDNHALIVNLIEIPNGQLTAKTFVYSKESYSDSNINVVRPNGFVRSNNNIHHVYRAVTALHAEQLRTEQYAVCFVLKQLIDNNSQILDELAIEFSKVKSTPDANKIDFINSKFNEKMKGTNWQDICAASHAVHRRTILPLKK